MEATLGDDVTGAVSAMSSRERLRTLVDTLDETQAEITVAFIDRLTSTFAGESDRDDADWVAQGRPFTLDSPLWDIVGMADSGPDGPTDVSRNKHKYLADAYADLHEEE
jgi:hypothetical protein